MEFMTSQHPSPGLLPLCDCPLCATSNIFSIWVSLIPMNRSDNVCMYITWLHTNTEYGNTSRRPRASHIGQWRVETKSEYWTRSFCPAILKTRIIEPLFPFFSLIRRKIWTWLTSKRPLLSPAQGALSIAEVSLFCACMPLIRSINSRWGPPEC